jgi:hypothetical protein
VCAWLASIVSDATLAVVGSNTSMRTATHVRGESSIMTFAVGISMIECAEARRR